MVTFISDRKRTRSWKVNKSDSRRQAGVRTDSNVEGHGRQWVVNQELREYKCLTGGQGQWFHSGPPIRNH